MRSRHRGLTRSGCLAVLSVATALCLTVTDADARRHGWHAHMRPGRFRHHAHHAALPVSAPGIAAMVVDAGSGRTLYASHEDELRHPASITKVMTLYLLFEKLSAGEMRLDTRIGVSAHAASMAPTKLGLRPGSSIAVEDAIKAIVTKSANDMAVAVAESIGGDEATFAELMTRKAHALGMSRTVYVNASGLPDDRQLTTARDLTVLGRAIRDQFPRYYHYFSTPSFTYAGQTMPNHNHLMARLEGMDGIKTGYTRASGFNLLSSVGRDGHRIVSVVLGGRTAASRDNIMASLIEDHIEDAAPTRVAGAETPSPIEEPAPTVQPSYGRQAESNADRGTSLIAPTLSVPPVPRPFDRARTPGPILAAGAPIERPRPAFIAGTPRPDAGRPGEPRRLAEDGSTGADAARRGGPAAPGTATPSAFVRLPPVKPPLLVASLAAAPVPVARPDSLAGRAHPEATRQAEDAGDRKEQAHGSGDWVIQLGATDTPDKAASLLDRARSQEGSTLASARPFTEKVRKGEATLYRARFAGLDTTEAEQACRALKRSGFACFATKD